MPTEDFQAQISSILEVLCSAAAAQICRVMEQRCAVLQLEISRGLEENQYLRGRVGVMERALLHRERGSQLLRSAASSRTELSSAEERGDLESSIKHEPVELESESDVLTVKEEKLQTVCSGFSRGVQCSVRIKVCQTDEVCTEEPDVAEKHRSTEEGEAASPEVPFEDALITTENEVNQSEAVIRVDVKTVCEGAETAGRGFPQQHFGFLSAQQSYSNSDVKSDFLTVDSGPADEELGGLGACLQRGAEEQVSTWPELQLRAGASDQRDLFSGASSDRVWMCDSQGHPSQSPGQPHILQGEPLVDCGVCGKRFSHMRQLKHHERVHAGERTYRCGRCGRQFPQLCRLKRHERVHTGEKPFRCTKCGKHFAQANNLKVHQSVHTGERSFSCAQCGKSFSFLSNLIRHKAVHTGK